MAKSSNFEKYTRDHKLKNRWVRQFLQLVGEVASITNAKTILDVGCGEGFVIEEILKKNRTAQITGIDFSKSTIETAKSRKLSAKFLVGSAYELPFPDDSFDLVLCTEVLEHLEDPKKALAEVRRVSKKYAILTTPNEPFFMLGNLAVGKNISRLGNDIEHINHWPWFAFIWFVQRNGFSVVKRHMPFPYLAFPWTLLLCEKSTSEKSTSEVNLGG